MCECQGSEFSGVPKVVDGDTVQFGDTKLQMEGIDAPQMDQLCFDKTGKRWRCGVASREYLKQQVGQQIVEVRGSSKKSVWPAPRQMPRRRRRHRASNGSGRLGSGFDYGIDNLSQK